MVFYNDRCGIRNIVTKAALLLFNFNFLTYADHISVHICAIHQQGISARFIGCVK